MASNRRSKGRNKPRNGNGSNVNNSNGSSQEAGQSQSTTPEQADLGKHVSTAEHSPITPQQQSPVSQAEHTKHAKDGAGSSAGHEPASQDMTATSQAASEAQPAAGDFNTAEQQSTPEPESSYSTVQPPAAMETQDMPAEETQQQEAAQDSEQPALNVDAPEFVPAAAREPQPGHAEPVFSAESAPANEPNTAAARKPEPAQAASAAHSQPAPSAEPAPASEAQPAAEPAGGYAAVVQERAPLEHVDEQRAARLLSMAKVPEPPAGVVSPAPSAQLSPEQAAVVGAWHAAYTAPSEAAQDKAIRSKYAPTAVFEDHLVKVRSASYIGTQFFALRQLFPRIEVFVAHVELLEGHEAVEAAQQAGALDGWLSRLLGTASLTTDDMYVLRIHNRQDLFLPFRNALTGLVLPECIPLWATSTLVVRASDDTILHHTDEWHNLPKLPWLVRSQVGGWSSWSMQTLLGW